jgi:hypothetical protein
MSTQETSTQIRPGYIETTPRAAADDSLHAVTNAGAPETRSEDAMQSTMQLRHLARETSSALELALVRMAPNALIEELAAVAGLLGALQELPLDTESLRVWATQVAGRATQSLERWNAWEERHRVTA